MPLSDNFPVECINCSIIESVDPNLVHDAPYKEHPVPDGEQQLELLSRPPPPRCINTGENSSSGPGNTSGPISMNLCIVTRA